MHRDKVELARDELKRRITSYAMDAEAIASDRAVSEKSSTQPSHHTTFNFYRVWASGLYHLLHSYLMIELWLDKGCSEDTCHNTTGGGEKFCERCEDIYRVLDDLDEPSQESLNDCNPYEDQ